ncbi:MAG: ABC transporter permease [Bacteroidales bacterium]|nr:ABC transporter permease [Bacteroidales bacterium]
MIKNYINIAIRFFFRNKLFSVINILSLSLGMSIFILINLWVLDEKGYDKFHENRNEIYRVIVEKVEEGQKKQTVRIPPAVSPVLKDKYPEIKNATRFFSDDVKLIKGKNKIQSYGAFVDTSFLSVFSFEFLEGSNNNFNKDVTSIIITEDIALRLFGKTNVVGESLNFGEDLIFSVAGVLKNIPANSHLKFDYLVPFDILYYYGLPNPLWLEVNTRLVTYIKLEKGVEKKVLEDKIKNIIKENNSEFQADIFLQPFQEIYLNSNYIGDFEGLGNKSHVYIISFISFLVLIIACLNFMNLSTAQATKRAKEIGLRKVVGAKRRHLIFQFVGEALIMAFVAYFFAMIMIELFMPSFNFISGKELQIPNSSLGFYIRIILLIIFTGLFASIYPAFLLSKVNVKDVFKGQIFSLVKGENFRKVLVIIQFSAAIALIAGAFLVNQQFKFLTSKNLGYKKEGVVYFSVKDNNESYKLIKERILKYPDIKSASVASHIINDVSHYITIDWEGKDPNVRTRLNTIFADHDLIKTLGMDIVAGRDFDKMIHSDTSEAFIINEKLADILGFEDPIGKKLSLLGRDGKIIGVVKNFHFKPLTYEIEPLVLTVIPDERFFCYTRLSGSDIQKSLIRIKSEYEKIFVGDEFQYYFLDETLENLYDNETRLKHLINIFTIFIVMISIMGLFGLVSFIASTKSKEFCVRKVLGASIYKSTRYFMFDILKLVLIAHSIGLPFAYYIIENWLSNFAYRINISIWPFLISSIITCTLAIITISLQSIKIAKVNPVDILQYE